MLNLSSETARDHLIGVLEKRYSGLNVMYVIDGAPTRQKIKTHQLRTEKRQKNIEQFNTLAAKNSGQKRVSGKNWKAFRSLRNRIYTTQHSEKQKLVKKMREKNMNVVLAKGEADVEIAKMDNVVVVSVDSDMVFHRNVKMVIKPQRLANGNYSFAIVEKTRVLSKLGLSIGKIVNFFQTKL